MPLAHLAATEARFAGKVANGRADYNGSEGFDDLPRVALDIAAADVGTFLEAGSLILECSLGDPGPAAALVVGLAHAHSTPVSCESQQYKGIELLYPAGLNEEMVFQI